MENRFLDIHQVVSEMTRETEKNIRELTNLQALVLAMLAGAFITFGALFSVLISAGVEQVGLVLLLQGFGFSVGFFMVILTGALLFSETNVVMPASALNCSTTDVIRGALKFWIIAIIGNVIGASVTGAVINFAHHYPIEVQENFDHILQKKMYFFQENTAQSWFKALLSGMFGNMLVGIAAIFAIMGKTIIGKYIPVLLAVSLFVAANFQHSPANMGYFSLGIPMLENVAWKDAILWNLIPAAIGNVLGGILLTALPLWYVWTDKN